MCIRDSPVKGLFLASFLVDGVLALPLAIFVHFNAFTVIDLVLHCYVITAFALFAGQCDLDTLFVLCHRSLLFKYCI